MRGIEAKLAVAANAKRILFFRIVEYTPEWYLCRPEVRVAVIDVQRFGLSKVAWS